MTGGMIVVYGKLLILLFAANYALKNLPRFKGAFFVVNARRNSKFFSVP